MLTDAHMLMNMALILFSWPKVYATINITIVFSPLALHVANR